MVFKVGFVGQKLELNIEKIVKSKIGMESATTTRHDIVFYAFKKNTSTVNQAEP